MNQIKTIQISMSFLIVVILFSGRINAQQFTRVTDGPHVNDGGGSWGASWIDYDNDSYLDLFVTNVNVPASSRNFLYHNEGDGTFSRVTGDIIVDDPYGWGGGVSWGDFDNDGNPDAYVAHWENQNNLFYQNNGNSTFTKITNGVLVNDGANSTSPGWADFDNDGDIDLYVANHDIGNFLFRNDGSGFTNITDGEIVTDVAHSNNAAWGDYNNDGYLDLFVANAWDDNRDCLYKNDGDGTFTKIITGDIVNNTFDSYGGSWADYDNDGDLDLFVTQVLWNNPGNSRNYLYKNNGDGSFSSVTGQPIVTDGAYSYGSSWGDFDNDGDLDLFVANSGVNFLYENNGEGTFNRVADGEITTDNNESNGAVWGDYDHDGDLDLFVTNGANFNENNTFYRNNGNSNNWLNIKCIGVASNKSAIGTKVRLKANGIWQLREISGQTGKNGQNSMNIHFGLGSASIIDSIKIEWPSGLVQLFTNIEVNHFITVEEGSVLNAESNTEFASLDNFELHQNYPNPFNPTTNISYQIPSETFVSLKIYDVLGNQVSTLFEGEKNAGNYEINFAAEDLPSGVYFYQLKAGNYSEIKKMVLLK